MDAAGRRSRDEEAFDMDAGSHRHEVAVHEDNVPMLLQLVPQPPQRRLLLSDDASVAAFPCLDVRRDSYKRAVEAGSTESPFAVVDSSLRLLPDLPRTVSSSYRRVSFWERPLLTKVPKRRPCPHSVDFHCSSRTT